MKTLGTKIGPLFLEIPVFLEDGPMKRLAFLVLALFVTACDGGGDSGSPAATPVYQATEPLNSRCYDGTAYCHGGIYSQYYGWSLYPGLQYGYNYMNYFNQYGFCNCAPGSIPAYNATNGLGCVRVDVMMGFVPLQWNLGARDGAPYYNGGWRAHEYPNNFGQVSNVSGYPTSNTCYNSLVQSCSIDIPNSCGVGNICQATNNGSRLGICVRY